LTETKYRTIDGTTISSKEIKKNKRCKYCRKTFVFLDNRHYKHCEKFQEYEHQIELEKAKNPQTNLDLFFEVVQRQALPIDNIHPNEWNVNSMSFEDFNELKQSIQTTKGEHLRKIPIQVRKINDEYYEIIDGEHRWKAMKELGFTHIPAIIEKDVNLEETKTLNVIQSNNRGKVDYFKLSKLLNEEYKDENEKKKCTQQELADRFGLSGKKEISNILKIYPRLEYIFEKSGVPDFFTNRQLEALARCRNDLLREKLIDHAIKEKWNSKEIRSHATKLNKIGKFLNEEFPPKVKECILNIYCGNSLFDLSYDKLIEKLFHQFTENSNLKCYVKYNRDFVQHSKIAEEYKKQYIEKHKTYKGWYKEYCSTQLFRAGAKMTWDFFSEYYRHKIPCWVCNKKIKNFNQYIPHHEEYEFKDDLLWYIFVDDIETGQKIFPVCNDCHQKGISTNWNKTK